MDLHRLHGMRTASLYLLASLAAAPAAAQMPAVGHIEIFGHPESADTVRAIVADFLGRSVSAEVRERARVIAALPGVADATIEAVCCEAGTATLYVAVRGEDDPAPAFAAPPSGAERLPPWIVATGERFELALEEAVRRGVTGEDQSAGHALMADSTARAVQREFIAIAATEVPLLRGVLASSADPGHRALAVQILAYAPDKRAVVPDLLAAVQDGEPAVRNAAMRALWIIAGYGAEHPAKEIEVPADPFIDLVAAGTWTDRNKASLVLMQLTAGRDSAMLESMRNRAFVPILEMARWRNPGHALPGVILLGRMAGLSEEAIAAALSEGKKDTLIEAALRARGSVER
jgi:hypothetical protein